MIRAVKGTRDLLPPATAVWNHVEAVARELFRRYNYQEIRTPILEETQLFARSVGEDTDIVMKEMYTFTDRDGSSLTLRPECTASVIRAYLEHRMEQWPGLKKFYYIGPMFRRERPQKGRFRQFYQIGAECIGSEAAVVDAEVIEMVVHFLQDVGLDGFELLLNSVGCRQCRPRFLSLLRRQLRADAPRLCEDCRRRAETNPLRVLDCKVPEDQPIIHGLPSILDHLCEACRTHFDSVKRALEQRAVEYRIVPRLVRGLDYYTRTTFEIVHGALGAQNSVLGGGRYDGLAEDLGARNPAPGIGYSIGQDRLVMILEEARPDAFRHVIDLFVAPLGDSAAEEAARIARQLRERGVCVEVAASGRLKRLMELSNRLGSRFTLILGEDEIATGTYSLKNMASGRQEPVTRDQLIERFSNY